MSNDETTYRVTNEAKIPAEALISTLTFRSTGWYSTDYNSLSKKVLAALANVGIEKVSDLEGWSYESLKEISGVSSLAAERLVMAAKRASVAYRGVGFPFEIDFTIQVPTERVAEVRALGKRFFKSVLEVDLDSMIAQAKQQVRLDLEEQISNLEAKLKEL